MREKIICSRLETYTVFFFISLPPLYTHTHTRTYNRLLNFSWSLISCCDEAASVIRASKLGPVGVRCRWQSELLPWKPSAVADQLAYQRQPSLRLCVSAVQRDVCTFMFMCAPVNSHVEFVAHCLLHNAPVSVKIHQCATSLKVVRKIISWVRILGCDSRTKKLDCETTGFFSIFGICSQSKSNK